MSASGHSFLLYKVDKNSDRQAVDEVCEKAAHQRHQKVSLDGGRIFFTEHLHVCHGVGRRSHSKATDSGRKNGSVVIASHDTEYDKVRVDKEQHGLTSQKHQRGRARAASCQSFRVIMAIPRNRTD